MALYAEQLRALAEDLQKVVDQLQSVGPVGVGQGVGEARRRVEDVARALLAIADDEDRRVARGAERMSALSADDIERLMRGEAPAQRDAAPRRRVHRPPP